MLEQFRSFPNSDIHILINNDTIWRYETTKDKRILEYLRIDNKNGVLTYVNPENRSKVFRDFNLFNNNIIYTIQENTNDRKSILGFDCYKATLSYTDNTMEDNFKGLIGKQITEMYVTKDIDLPLHIIFYTSEYLPGFFPL